MAIEQELKFDISAPCAEQVGGHPALGVLAGAPRREVLSTRYFDTADGRLAAAGVALRLRHGGGAAVVTVKTASGDALGLVRGEWEWPAQPGAADDALHPADLARAFALAPLAGLALDGGDALLPVFGTRFERLAWDVAWDDTRLEVALDRGACEAWRDGARVSAPLCELEIELKAGDAAHAWDLAWALAQDLPLHLSPVNKAQRAAALARGERVRALPEPPRLAAADSLGDAARLWLSTAAAQLAVWSRRICEADEARDVHQLRVVTRRLRTALRWLAPHASRRALAWLAAELSWTMRLAGAVRDADVWLARLRAFDPPPEALLHRIEDERRTHRALLCTHLQGARFGRLLLALARFADTWGPRGDAGGARRLARDVVRRETRQWRAALDDARGALRCAKEGRTPSEAEALAVHAWRIRTKRLRLAFERLGHLLRPEHAAREAALAAACEALQTYLGRWHDAQRLAQHAAGGLTPAQRDELRAAAQNALAAAAGALPARQ